MTLFEVRALTAALSDTDILTLTLFGECRGEPIDGQIAVGQVIRNRVRIDIGKDGKPDWWGEGYRGVCLAPKQFSCWNDGDPTQATLILETSRMRNGQESVQPTVMKQLQWIADGITRGVVNDDLRGATHYHAESVSPSWAKAMIVVARKGHHIFYREKT